MNAENASGASGSYADTYRRYLESNLQGDDALSSIAAAVDQALEHTQWETPETARDCRNVAVLALIMADQGDDSYLRRLYLDTALDALQSGRDALCIAHRCLVEVLLGETRAVRNALSSLLTVAAEADASPLGLVYLPPTTPPRLRSHLLRHLWQAKSAQHQALLITVEALRRSPLAFYSAQGLRFLQLAAAHYPQVAPLQLQLGLANLFNSRIEGMVNLHQAQTLDSDDAIPYQALYLAYRPLSASQAAQWQQRATTALAHRDPEARDRAVSLEHSPAWQWTRLPPDSPVTSVPFEGLTLTVEASLSSIVTSVLLAQGTWFEAELTLWRQELQPGMVAIDVGANVGVYTFSAAARVGNSGRVLAVEPFKGCVQCLKHTCRTNDLDWVTICAAAASDRPGTAQLALHRSSELNELVIDPERGSSAAVDTVPCITLDSLVDQYKLERVDWIKIDAEGHELAVLQGATSLLNRFKPRILYENVAAGQKANLEVSRWLQQRGYRLYRYRHYLRELEPVAGLEETQGTLNLIAISAP